MSAVQSRYGCRALAGDSAYASVSDVAAMPVSRRRWNFARVRRSTKARRAVAAVGRARREGRVMVERV